MSIAVYLHIPFCLTKCGYCSFFSVPYNRSELDKYYRFLKLEIALYAEQSYFSADTIYFGGGTPSLLPPEYIREIIGLLEPVSTAEITLEVNPVQITAGFLASLADTGVNRLSLGVQSMHDRNLQMLGRKHKADSMPERMRLCRKYHFTNLSVDFMYGLPGVSLEEVKNDLLEMLELKPRHISSYLLSLQPDAPFAHWVGDLPTDEAAAEQYEMICITLKKHGFNQYEISNFAKPGFRSKHNLHYWQCDNFLGIGAGASSCIRGFRYANQDNIEEWKQHILEGRLTEVRLDENISTLKADFIIMQLRLNRGLDRYEYNRRFNSDIMRDYSTVIAKYTDMGYLERKGRYLRFTSKALFVSNHILSEFV